MACCVIDGTVHRLQRGHKGSACYILHGFRVEFKSFYLAHHDLVCQPRRSSTSPAGSLSLRTDQGCWRLDFCSLAFRGSGEGWSGGELCPEGPWPGEHVFSPTLAISPPHRAPEHLRSVLATNPGPPTGAFSDPALPAQGTRSCPDSGGCAGSGGGGA